MTGQEFGKMGSKLSTQWSSKKIAGAYKEKKRVY